MAHDDARVATMADLFHPEPQQWGFRGDPYLWRALREHLSGTRIPPSADAAAGLLHAAASRGSGWPAAPGYGVTVAVTAETYAS